LVLHKGIEMLKHGRMGMHAALAMAAMAGMGMAASTNMAGPPLRHPRQRRATALDTTRRYFGMTDEQRAWNLAVDAKRQRK
jgi:hypothetical protein